MAIILGKNVSITGVSGVRSCTVSHSSSEIDTTTLGSTQRSFTKALIEQTIELECVDSPGVTAGNTFTVGGTSTGNATYVCTSVAESQPIDGIVTYTVSGSRTTSST